MEIKNIDIDEIKVRENSRLENRSISTLAKSIKENGLLQPIMVKEIKQPTNEFQYEIILGHRRYAAIKKLKWESIPCIIVQNTNEKGSLIRNLTENLQREDISAAERGRYYEILTRDFKLSTKDISKELGIPECNVKTAIDVYSFVPKEYRDRVKFVSTTHGKQTKGVIPATTAKEILNIEREQRLTVDAKSKLFDASLNGQLSFDKLKLAGVFLKYGMDINDAVKLSEEYDIARIYVPIKKKEIENAMAKYNIHSKRKLFRDILAGDLKITFNIPKYDE